MVDLKRVPRFAPTPPLIHTNPSLLPVINKMGEGGAKGRGLSALPPTPHQFSLYLLYNESIKYIYIFEGGEGGKSPPFGAPSPHFIYHL